MALSVRDIDRSADWYAGLLDLTLVAETDDGAPMKIFVNDCGQAIDLRQDLGVAPEPFTQTRVGLDHLAFSCADLAELEAWLHRIQGRGVTHSPIATSPFGTHLTFRDPDGIPLEFFVPTAR
ncbi:MAG: VOC family protein [Kineosporiaceae bacterium]|nr:VOC family protein [Kineosporiaceae bacterium]